MKDDSRTRTQLVDELSGLRQQMAELKTRLASCKQDMRDSQDRFAMVEETAHLGSWEMDIATGKSQWTDEFFRICGLEPGAIEPTAERGMELIHPDDRKAAADALEQAIEGDGRYDIEKRILRPDGAVRHVHATGKVVFDKERRPEKILGSFLDITERKQDEEALRQSQERLDSLVAHLPEGVCLLDAEQRLVLANPQARTYLPVLTEAMLGETVTHLGDHDLKECLLPRSPGESPRCEIRVEGPPQRIFTSTANPLKPVGQAGWVLLLEEVTQEREIEEKLTKQERLATVGQLAAGIAHDFNNMLTVIIGMAQLAGRNRDLPDPVKANMETIQEQGQRAGRLIRQILDFSRRSAVEPQRMLLAPFLKETVKLLVETLPETIQTVTRIEAEECVVHADPGQLQQVLGNLIVNARDAMPQGGKLRIELARLRLPEPLFPGMEPGEWVRWIVADTGIGMSPEIKAHIFDPFFTTKQVGEGTGLGLSQVYGIVTQGGGFIDVESTEGKGTTFTIYLPHLEKEEQASPVAAVSEPSSGGELILVVEDANQVRELIRDVLAERGYRVLMSTNGREALSLYATHRREIALVLTDLVMPVMGGVELFEILKEKDPDLPVVFMTGYATEETGRSTLPADSAGILEKPLILDQLTQMVSSSVKTRGEPQ